MVGLGRVSVWTRIGWLRRDTIFDHWPVPERPILVGLPVEDRVMGRRGLILLFSSAVGVAAVTAITLGPARLSSLAAAFSGTRGRHPPGARGATRKIEAELDR